MFLIKIDFKQDIFLKREMLRICGQLYVMPKDVLPRKEKKIYFEMQVYRVNLVYAFVSLICIRYL